MNTYAVDFETTYDRQRDIKTLGYKSYLAHPETDIYLVSIVGSDGFEWVGNPAEAPWDVIEDQALVSHNRSFDKACLERCQELGIEIPDYYEWHCTADLCAYLGVARNLAGASEILLDKTADKSTRDQMRGKSWGELTAEGQEGLKEYALNDSRLCLELWLKHSHLWPEHERLLSLHTTLMCHKGIGLDLDACQEAIDSLNQTLFDCRQTIPWARETDAKGKPFAPSSPKQLNIYCAKAKVPAPPLKSKEPEKYADWLEKYGEKVPFVSAVADYRSINRTLELVKKMQTYSQDGRMYYGMKYFGAHTGRWCLPGSYEVLSPTGWQPLQSWDGGTILQWKNGELQFLPATANKFPKGNSCMRFASSRNEFVCTPEHRILAVTSKGNYKTILASEALRLGKIQFVKTGYVSTEAPIPIADVLMRVWAMCQADGCKISSEKFNGWRFGFRKKRKIDRCKKLLEQAGIPFRKNRCSDRVVFTFLERDTPWMISKEFDLKLLLSCSAKNLEIFIEELIHWDGHKENNSKGFSYSTTSKQCAEAVATVCHLIGKSASLKKRKRAQSNWSDCYNVFISNRTYCSFKNDQTHRSHWVNGPVYCPSTQTGYFLVRNHKKQIFVTGNSGDSGINMQNFPKEEKFGINLRSLMVSKPGHQFIVADYAQIEARVLLWLAGDDAQLEIIRKGVDVYEAHARQTMGYSDSRPLHEVDKSLRQYAKARVLGLGYQCGHAKFKVLAKVKCNLDLSLSESKRMVTDFRRRNPKIVKLWNLLDHAFKRSKGQDFELELPSGRTLTYYNVVSSGGWRAKVIRGKSYPAKFLYGGLLTENLVQATARDIMAEAIVKLECADLPVVLHVHDEVVCEVPKGTDPKQVEEILTELPEWAEGLPLEAEAKATERYGK